MRSRSLPFCCPWGQGPGLKGLAAGLCLLLLGACEPQPPSQAEETAAPAPVSSDSTVSTPAAPSAPPPPPSSAFLALLPPEQTAQIRDLELPLVLPTAIPAGFAVEQVEAARDERFEGYQILYRDDRDRCFLIEYTTEGVGDMPQTANRHPLSSPVLSIQPEATGSYGLNYGPYVDPALRDQFPETLLVTDWLPVAGGVVRFAGAALIETMLSPNSPCQNVTVEEAIAIIDSIAVIDAQISGDDSPG
ncbi:MAG: hypothetical protein ACFBSG_11255 [Leptolyngbyaceae cyanobacterium]